MQIMKMFIRMRLVGCFRHKMELLGQRRTRGGGKTKEMQGETENLVEEHILNII